MSEGRILIVDDDNKTRNAYKDLFDECGFDAHVAENESRAFELLKNESYQAVVIDLMVANNTLFSVAEKMKKEFPHVFISLMLVDSTPVMIKKAIDAGIDEYLVKPLLPMRLIDGVKKGILRYKLEEENRQLKEQLEEIKTQNRQWIMHDLETGVFNSQYFNERLDTEVKRAKRHEHWLSLLLCDLGGVGIGEDGTSTSSADEIVELLKVLSRNIRDVDIIARYSSGFAIILPETTLEGSYTLRDRLKKGLIDTLEGNNSENRVDLNPSIPKLNVRFGAAAYPLDSHLPRKLIKIAEDRLQ